MSDIGHVFSASTIGAVVFGGVSSAEFANSQEDSVQPFLSSKFDIVKISTLHPEDAAYLAFGRQAPNSLLSRKLQAAIIATPKAMKQLTAYHVDVTSVVGLLLNAASLLRHSFSSGTLGCRKLGQTCGIARHGIDFKIHEVAHLPLAPCGHFQSVADQQNIEIAMRYGIDGQRSAIQCH
jgi:hypothetical protein